MSSEVGKSFEWTPDMTTGVEELDAQHRTLLTTLVTFRDAIRSGVTGEQLTQALDSLEAYSNDHFSLEERCMLAHRCSAMACNRMEHQVFRSMLGAFRKRLDSEGATPSLAYLVEEFLLKWIVKHIGQVDTQLADAVKDRAQSA